MRLLFVPHAPGTRLRTRSYELAKAMARLGHDVDLFGIDLQPPALHVHQKLAWHAHQLLRGAQRHRIADNLCRLTLPALFRGPRRLGAWLQELNARIVRLEHYDRIYHAAYSGFSPLGGAAEVVYDVVDDHRAGEHASEGPNDVSSIVSYVRRHISEADVVTASSLSLAEMVRREHAREVHYVPNGADVRDIARQHGIQTVPFRIGYVGGLDAWVDLGLLIGAVAEVRKDAPQAHLVLVGDGAEISQVELPDWVQWTGFVDPEVIPKWLHSFHVGVVPFRLSPFTHVALPLKAIEYGAARKATVSTQLEELRLQSLPWVKLADYNVQAMSTAILEGFQREWNPSWDTRVWEYDWERSAAVLCKL